mgnify:CR=1 FL=1
MRSSRRAQMGSLTIRAAGDRRAHQERAGLVAVAMLLAAVASLPSASPAGAAEMAPAESSAEPGADAGEAGEAPSESLRLPEQTVVGERETLRFLPDVKGTDVYDGKKTAVIDPTEAPKIVNDNYRQALSRTPGLVLAEESTPLLSIGYRGLDPHRTQFTQVLKDGIPIAADLFGYPENYYMPPLDAVQQIDVVHGGAALLYGPQPGGALNFVMKKDLEGVEIDTDDSLTDRGEGGTKTISRTRGAIST